MIDYQSKFDFNMKYLDSPEYQLYNKSLIEFYNKDNLSDKSNFIRSIKNGILMIESKKSGYFLKIIDAKYVNINTELENIKKNKNILKNKIENLFTTDDTSNIKEKFIKIKEKYIELSKQETSINDVLNIQNKNIISIENNIN